MKYYEALDEQRVVVTGMGCVSPLGLNLDTSFREMVAGNHGLIPVPEEFRDYSFVADYGVSAVGKVPGFDDEVLIEKTGITRKESRFFHGSAKLALVAISEAMYQAGLAQEGSLKIDGIDPTSIGLSVGSGVAGGDTLGEVKAKVESGGRIPPTMSMKGFPERVVTIASMMTGIKGAAHYTSAACATGNDAIIDGIRKVKLGELDIVIVGGSEAQVTMEALGMFAGLTALDNSPVESASRPFNDTEKGFVMSEGAGILVLESLKSAIKRGAMIYGEVAGYGDTADASDPTMLSGEGSERAVRQALSTVDDASTIYVNAHATGTEGDKKELEVIRNTISLERLRAISSTKSATGHMIGAAGAVEALVCLKALITGEVPPTTKLDSIVEIGRNLPVVANELKRVTFDVAVNNSFGFGGLNKVVAFARLL